MIGAGIASVNEWANALDAGREGDLAAPQPGARRAGPEHAALLLRGVRASTRSRSCSFDAARRVPRRDPEGHLAAPARLDRRSSERGSHEGRFDQLIGEIDVDRARPGRAAGSTSRAGTAPTPGWLDVTGVVCGDRASCSRRSRSRWSAGSSSSTSCRSRTGRLVLRSNCGVPGLDLRRVAALRRWGCSRTRRSRTATRSPG